MDVGALGAVSPTARVQVGALVADGACIVRTARGLSLRGGDERTAARCRALKPLILDWLAVTYPSDYLFHEPAQHTNFVQRVAVMFNGRVVRTSDRED